MPVIINTGGLMHRLMYSELKSTKALHFVARPDDAPADRDFAPLDFTPLEVDKYTGRTHM